MTKLLLLPLAIIFACILAGLYGAIHNQISYSVSPDYFHEFKFAQFRIDAGFHNRFGASIVGWRASWWMGIILGLPIYFLGLFVRGTEQFIRAYLKAASPVVLVTFAIGVIALIISFFSISQSDLPNWVNGRNLSNPVAFSRAGTMHNFSYLGGFVGLVIGSLVIVREAWLSRRHPLVQSNHN